MVEDAVVITGGGSGIGRAITLECARRGWTVAVLDIDAEAAGTVAACALEQGARSATAHHCDVSDEPSVRTVFAAISALAPIRGVVANAGIEHNAPVHELELGDWQRTIDVNLTGVFLTCKHALRGMLEHGTAASIVCTSSPAAFVGFAGGSNAAYAASKGGVTAFVRSAAIDYAAAGIRINAIVPGATDTPLLRDSPSAGASPGLDARIETLAAEQIPLGRLAQPEEIARAAVWLLSDDAAYVTGTSLVCDGGLLARGANTF